MQPENSCLYLYVPRGVHKLLHEHPVVPEGGLGLLTAQTESHSGLIVVPGDPHPLTTLTQISFTDKQKA